MSSQGETPLTREEERLAARAQADIEALSGWTLAAEFGLVEIVSLISMAQLGMQHPQAAPSQPARVAREVIDAMIEELPTYTIRALARAGYREGKGDRTDG